MVFHDFGNFIFILLGWGEVLKNNGETHLRLTHKNP